jgi:hypothetical protein
MVPQGGEPPGAGPPFDGRGAPDIRRDKRSPGRDIHHRSCADAEHGVHAGLDEQGEMGVGAQAPIGYESIPWVEARMDRRHLGQIVGEEGCDHRLQEPTGARMAQPQPPRHGKAAPGPLRCWWAERIL